MSFFKNTKVNTTISFDDEQSDNDSSSDSLSDNELSGLENELEDNLETKLNDNLEIDNTIIVFGDKNGRRTNTYIVGLNTTDEIRKSYLKSLKTKYACNGSIKKITYDNIEQIVIHLQGDQILNVKTFLIKEKVQQPINIKLIE